MSKLLMLVLTSLLGISANAQFSFGFHVDPFLSFGSAKIEDEPNPSSDVCIGGKAGVIANIPIRKNISFTPELNVALRGTKFSLSSTSYQTTYLGVLEIQPVFLESVFNFTFSKPVKSGAFFLAVGPVISIGMSGSYTESATDDGSGSPQTDTREGDIVFDGDAEAGDDNLHMKPVEIGISGIAGYRTNSGFFVRILATNGLTNLNPIEGNSYKSSYLGLGIGWLFTKKSK